MVNQNTLLKGFLSDNHQEIDAQRIQLIRVLSRTGTLPKVTDLKVQYIHSQPEMFLMVPGKQLRIGVRLLDKPVLALLALRFGIEWHIWFNAIKKVSTDLRICDLAAALAAARFIDLLPAEDKKELESGFPDDLKGLYNKLKTIPIRSEEAANIDLNVVSKFHRQALPNTPIALEMLDIIGHLAVPTEALMMTGGDLRLNVENDHLLNMYGCRPFPRPEAFSFASSTATSISNSAFDQTQKQREKLIKETFLLGLEKAYKKNKANLIDRLKQGFKFRKSASIIISPSGTDISLLFAGICQTVYGDKLTHILVASDETGSGVPMALAGKHFADTSALNIPVKKEALIEGFKEVGVHKIPLRDASGKLKSKQKMDDEVDVLIRDAFANGLKPILHVMDQSKLGYAAPSQSYLDFIKKKYNDKVLVLVDNSQLRMDQTRIEEYLKKGFMLTITGSKFYTGPPFSGALVVSSKIAEKLTTVQNKLPIGFKEYYLKSEFIDNTALSEVLAEGYNIGSYLRWYAALTEIERYNEVPVTLRKLGIELFCEHVANRIENSPCLVSLEARSNTGDLPLPEEHRTIFPFFILKENKVLSHPEADRLYRLLNMDITSLANFENDEEKRIAKQMCHIGQPVKVLYNHQEPSAVLRISLGARIISESWENNDVSLYFKKIEDQLNQVDIIMNKIGLILKHAEALKISS